MHRRACRRTWVDAGGGNGCVRVSRGGDAGEEDVGAGCGRGDHSGADFFFFWLSSSLCLVGDPHVGARFRGSLEGTKSDDDRTPLTPIFISKDKEMYCFVIPVF